jgi:hypothetical protein
MINGDAIGTEFDYSERKKELQNKKQQFQDDIDSELTGLKANAIHYGKYALIVGGAFVATYVVLGLLFPEEEEKEKTREKIIYVAAEGDDKQVVHTQHESTMSPVAKAILTSISTFLISIAKEKLLAYLEQLKSNEGQEDTQPAS